MCIGTHLSQWNFSRGNGAVAPDSGPTPQLETAQRPNKTSHNGIFEVQIAQWPQRTSERQTKQCDNGTLTLHKAQWNNGTVTMEALKWKPRSGPRKPLKCKAGSGTMEP